MKSRFIQEQETSAVPLKRSWLIWNALIMMLKRDLIVLRHQFVAFLLQVLLQPLFFLFTLGIILPITGIASRDFGALLFPGIVALSIFVTSLQSVALPLTIELGYLREIEDRLLAPIPVSLVALEKILFASIIGLIAGLSVFLLSFLVLSQTLAIHTDVLVSITIVMLLSALSGACLGLTFGTVIKPERMTLAFSVFLTPIIFTGCVQYPWSMLKSLRWFQILTLFNPLTYASEGFRATLLSPAQNALTMDIHYSLLGLGLSVLFFFSVGMFTFHYRVID